MHLLLIAARSLHFAASASLMGVFAFHCLVADPAFRRAGGESAAAPSERRLRRLAWASLALALVSGAVWFAEVAAEMSGKPLDAMLAQGVLGVVLIRTRFGEVFLLRLGFAALLAFCLAPERRIDGALRWATLALAALIVASLAWAGHGGATPGTPGDLHLVADIVHLLAAGLWLGTLLPLALLLAEARHSSKDDWAHIAQIAVGRYSRLAMASVLALLAGGLVNTWFLAGTVPAMVGTEYGRLLLVKIALFVAMLLIAAVNLRRLGPRLAASGSACLLYTSPSPRDLSTSRMPSSA